MYKITQSLNGDYSKGIKMKKLLKVGLIIVSVMGLSQDAFSMGSLPSKIRMRSIYYKNKMLDFIRGPKPFVSTKVKNNPQPTATLTYSNDKGMGEITGYESKIIHDSFGYMDLGDARIPTGYEKGSIEENPYFRKVEFKKRENYKGKGPKNFNLTIFSRPILMDSEKKPVHAIRSFSVEKTFNRRRAFNKAIESDL